MPATQPGEAVAAALDKLERVYADMGLPATEQETVPAARADLAGMVEALGAGDKLAKYAESTLAGKLQIQADFDRQTGGGVPVELAQAVAYHTARGGAR